MMEKRYIVDLLSPYIVYLLSLLKVVVVLCRRTHVAGAADRLGGTPG